MRDCTLIVFFIMHPVCIYIYIYIYIVHKFIPVFSLIKEYVMGFATMYNCLYHIHKLYWSIRLPAILSFLPHIYVLLSYIPFKTVMFFVWWIVLLPPKSEKSLHQLLTNVAIWGEKTSNQNTTVRIKVLQKTWSNKYITYNNNSMLH